MNIMIVQIFCTFGMLIFAGVQVWLMLAQNRQQIHMKRFELAQQLDIVADKFEGDWDSAGLVLDWIAQHQSSFAFLLRKKDTQSVIVLFQFVMKIRRGPCILDATTKIKNTRDFNTLVNNVSACLGAARYGFVKENTQKVNNNP